eukprot:4529638-Prymnesium_polylepis.1
MPSLPKSPERQPRARCPSSWSAAPASAAPPFAPLPPWPPAVTPRAAPPALPHAERDPLHHVKPWAAEWSVSSMVADRRLIESLPARVNLR